MRVRPMLLLASLAFASGAAAQVSLRELPELARQRAERLRPQQIKALEPFWADLKLDYAINQEVLERRIADVADLGDNIVPLLLEKLAPAQGGAASRNLAANCRRVLERFDPGSFVDALAELAKGDNEIGRAEAIRLLGLARVPQAGRILTELVDSTTGEDQRLVVRSLKLLQIKEAAPRVVPMLASQDRRVREDVLAYLIACRADEVAATVAQALEAEGDTRMLPHYIDYFAACVRHDERAAAALLPLLEGDKLDWQDTRTLVEALAKVAPPGHPPTCRKLLEMVDANDTGFLAVEAAVSLHDLGDKQGVTRLRKTLDEQIRRRKREVQLYEKRASLLFAIEEYGDAIDDFEQVLDHTEGMAMTRRAYVGLIRAEARRKGRVQNLLRHMKASNMTVAEYNDLAASDPAVKAAFDHDSVRRFLRAQAKAEAPK